MVVLQCGGLSGALFVVLIHGPNFEDFHRLHVDVEVLLAGWPFAGVKADHVDVGVSYFVAVPVRRPDQPGDRYFKIKLLRLLPR